MTTVERSLQAGEILQAVAQKRDKERVRWMKSAGLVEIKRVTIRVNKVSCLLSIMAPILPHLNVGSDPSSTDICVEGSQEINRNSVEEGEQGATDLPSKKVANSKLSSSTSDGEERFSEGELVIGIIDCPSGSSNKVEEIKLLLQTMTQKVEYLCLNSVGLVKEEVTVQPTLLAMAVDALQQIEEYILPILSHPKEEVEVEEKDYNVTLEPLEINMDSSSSVLKQVSNSTDEDSLLSILPDVEVAPTLNALGEPLPRKVTILGTY